MPADRTTTSINAPVGRVYRARLWYRALALIFVLIGLGAAGRGIAILQDDSSVGLIVIGAIAAIFGAAMTAFTATARIRFSDSAIDQSSFLDQKTLLFSSIRGRREYMRWVGRSPARFIRIDSMSGRDRIEIRKWFYDFDDDFWNWFDSLPDLDEHDE